MNDIEPISREIFSLFPTAIQISKLPNSQIINHDLIREVHKIRKSTPNGRPDSWTSSVYTTLFTADQLHTNEQFKDLTNTVLQEACNFAQSLGINQDAFKLVYKDCWFNIYGWKDGQEIHIHHNSIISGSYYLKVPNGSSGLVLHSPVMDSMFLPPQKEDNVFNIGFDELFVEEGMLVLFRSNLRHSVRPSEIKKNRISISFNFILK